MKKHAILIIASMILILTCISSAYAADPQNTSVNNSSSNSTLQSSSISNIYVNGTGGNDKNNGTSWQYAKKTIQVGIDSSSKEGNLYIANGVYNLTEELEIDGKNLNITGQDRNNTIIDGQGKTRIFYIDDGTIVTITNLTIRNGKAPNGGDGSDGHNGGGVYNEGTLILNTCYIYNNTAGKGGNGKFDSRDGGNGGNGGGIYTKNKCSITYANIYNNKGGDGYTSDSKVYDSVNGGHGGDGGAIFNEGTLTLQNCIITSNKAGDGASGKYSSSAEACGGTGGHGGDGGAIANTGTLTITNCQISQNKAGTGGTGGSSNANSGFDGGNGGNGGAGGTDDAYGSHSSDGGNGGNGGGITIISKSIAKSPLYNLNLNIYESIITNNKAGTGGQPYLTGKKGSNGVGGGLYSNDNHYFTVNFCRIVDNSPQAIYLVLSCNNMYTYLNNNWWGSNNEPIGQVAGNYIDPAYYATWLILSINATPNPIYTGQVSNVAANLIMNSNGDNTLLDWAMYVPNGIPVSFSTNSGNVNPQNGFTSVGALNTVFTANSASGTALVYATVDNQTVNATIQILPSSDIGVSKTVDNSRPNVGDKVTFTVTARNNGPDNATNIQITDKMPGGFSNVVITPSIGTYDSTTRIWTIPSLANGAAATLTMNGTVTGDLAGKTTTNNATKIYEDQFDPNPNNDKTNVSIYVPMADIHVAKNVDKNMPNVEDTVTFTVTVINDGPDNATNIQITDIMPAGFNNVVITPSIGTYNSITGVWTIPSLANGTNATLTLSGTITIAGIVTNTATKTAEDQYDPTPDDDTTSTSTNAQEADISIIKTVNKQRANVGENVTFTITVTNNGPNNATGLIFIDKLPVGLQYDSAAADKGSLPHLGNYILWNLGNLNNAKQQH